MATPSIASGLSTFRKGRFVSDARSGDVLWTNGIDYPRRYRTGAAAMDLAGIFAPETAPSMSNPAGGSLSAGDYVCYYRYVESRDDRSVDLFSNFSPATTNTAAANDYHSWGASSDLEISSQSRVTHVELFTNTIGQTTTFYRRVRIGAAGTITGLAVNAGVSYTLTTLEKHGLVAGARIKITAAGTYTGNAATDLAANAYLIVTSAPTAYTFTVLAADTTSTNPTGTLASGTPTWATVGYRKTAAGAGGDTTSDADVVAETFAYYLVQPFTDDANLPSAMRHTPPPDFMSVAVFYNDRMHYLAPVRYTQGTISMTAGDETVTGSGTAFTAAMVGRVILPEGSTRPYTVASVTNGTSLELTEKAIASVTAGSDYSIYPLPKEFITVYASERDLGESVPRTNDIPLQQVVDDHDDIVGGFPLGSSLFIVMRRQIHRIWYESQEVFEARASFVAMRGAFNQSCHDVFEKVVYLMDEFGCWRFTGGGEPDPISGPLQNLFRDGTVDFSRSHQFHVRVDPNQQCVYFFVHYTGDAVGLPHRWAKYNLRTAAWWTGSGVHGFGASCWGELDGRQRLLVGGEDDRVYVMHEGLSDHLATAVRGVVVSGSGTTVVIPAAGISLDDWARASVAILHKATGLCEVRKVTGNTATSGGGNVTITTAAWSETPRAGDIVTVGGIVAGGKTGAFDLVGGDQGEGGNERGSRIYFEPTTNAGEILLAQWYDYDTEAAPFGYPDNPGTGARTLEGTAWLEIDTIAVQEEVRNSGYQKLPIVGQTGDSGRSRRSVQIEVYAIQGLDAIAIDELIAEGVA